MVCLVNSCLAIFMLSQAELCVLCSVISQLFSVTLTFILPRAGSGVVRIDPLRSPGQMSYKATKPGSVCPVKVSFDVFVLCW